MPTPLQDGRLSGRWSLATASGLMAASLAGHPAAAQTAASGSSQAGVPAVRLGTGMDAAQPDDLVLPDLDVVARRLDAARLSIQPSLGATRTDFGRQAIEAIPQGDNAGLNQVLLRAPGVVQDAFGNVFIRGDHRNVQYRINGVQLPEGLAGFASTLQARFANQVSLLTGALPAQYGFSAPQASWRSRPRTGVSSPRHHRVPVWRAAAAWRSRASSMAGAAARWTTSSPVTTCAATSASRTQAAASTPPTTRPTRARGFAYVSGILDDTTRLTLMTGTSYADFRIPTQNGVSPGLGLAVNGVSGFDSNTLRQRQREFLSTAE